MAVENPADHYSAKVSLKAVIEREGKVLLAKTLGYDHWDLPGGTMHKGESPEEGLSREIREELGVDIRIGTLIHAVTYEKSNTNEPHLLLAYKASVDPAYARFVLAPDEIEEIMWVGEEEFESVHLWDACKKALRRFYGRHL